MNFFGIIIILFLIFGAYYAYTQDLFNVNTITNPLDDYLEKARNNTPSSTITETDNVKYFGKPWQYYSCINDESCKSTFGPGVFCNMTRGECYTIN